MLALKLKGNLTELLGSVISVNDEVCTAIPPSSVSYL